MLYIKYRVVHVFGKKLILFCHTSCHDEVSREMINCPSVDENRACLLLVRGWFYIYREIMEERIETQEHAEKKQEKRAQWKN